jgi:hypothetical protein
MRYERFKQKKFSAFRASGCVYNFISVATLQLQLHLGRDCYSMNSEFMQEIIRIR